MFFSWAGSAKMLDTLAEWFGAVHMLGTTLAIDSSLYDTHHRSRHYEQRCRRFASSVSKTANSRRSSSARRTRSSAIGADTASHVILACASADRHGG